MIIALKAKLLGETSDLSFYFRHIYFFDEFTCVLIVISIVYNGSTNVSSIKNPKRMKSLSKLIQVKLQSYARSHLDNYKKHFRLADKRM